MTVIKVDNRYIGKGYPSLMIAEVGVNHNGDIERGFDLIDKAADGGADVVKFQTYKASQITTKKAARYWNESLNDEQGGTQFDTFSKLDGMDLAGYKELKKKCQSRKVIFTSTPFNLPDVEILEEIGVDMYKISSSDVTYYDLIKLVANTTKPVIISTGCASLTEISKAVEVAKKAGATDIILQHCILQYPCEDQNANLIKMQRIQSAFPDIPVGYSDHTVGITIPTMAVALGAVTVEKHFTVDSSLPDSPDHKFSLTPKNYKMMVEEIRRVEMAYGKFIDGYYPAEEEAFKLARKSLVTSCFIKKGTILSKEMLTAKRPGTGIYPENSEFIVGRVANKDIEEDTTISLDMF